MSTFQRIKQLLDKEEIKYKLTKHASVKTSQEAADIRGVPLKTGAKAMVVKSKEKYFLLVLTADKRLDWKKIKKQLNVKEIRLATAEEAEKITGSRVGSIPPFGSVLGLPTYFDKGILENKNVNFNPGSRTHSIHMSTKDLIRLTKPIMSQLS